MEFERHSEISFPIGQIDRKRLTDWLDERMIQFVQTYLAVHENPYYLKDQMVEDPVAGIRFPKFTAAATREYRGTIYYFVAEETAAEFEKSHT
jgi:YHS domain-containing protein